MNAFMYMCAMVLKAGLVMVHEETEHTFKILVGKVGKSDME